MVQVKKMRLPLFAEYSHLARLTNGSDAWIHWSGILCWCLDEDPIRPAFHGTRGHASCRDRAFMPDDVRSEAIGFRPAFEAEANILDGQDCVVGTLFMDGEPVRIPACSKFAVSYVPGATLELRPALEDENFQVQAIKVGNVLIADRVLLKNISWNDIREVLGGDKPATQNAQKLLRLGKMRFPTCAEYDSLADTAKEANDIMHWKGIYSWCQDVRPGWPSSRVVCGVRSAHYRSSCIASNRYVDVGFRPVIEILSPDALYPDGATVIAGTLYMDGYPVRVPKKSTFGGDIPDYIPGTKLELREALDDPAYQVRAIRTGGVLAADRVLLKNISWDDLAKLGFCGNKILKGETIMKDMAIIYLGNADDAYTIACSKENEEKVLTFLSKRYPKWIRDCKGGGSVLRNKILESVGMMKELLEDENLELLGENNKAVIRLRDEVYGDSVVLCSRDNEERVKAFLLKRYPKWSGNCIGKTGLTPWNDVVDAVRDMKELLGDENLEFQPSLRDILIPTDPTKN